MSDQNMNSKLMQLCEYVHSGENSNKRNYLIHKAALMGLPLNTSYTNERYIYNICIAIVNLMNERYEGFQLATIMLKDLFVKKNYWDILHHIYQLKNEINQFINNTQEVLENIQVKNVSYAWNLNRGYMCHCERQHENPFWLLNTKPKTF